MESINISGYPGVVKVTGIAYSAAIGDYYYPILDIQVDIKCDPLRLTGDTFSDYTIIQLSGQLVFNNNAISVSPLIHPFAEISDHSVDYPCHFQFPLDIQRLEHIEDIRRGDAPEFEMRIEGIASIEGGKTKIVRIWLSRPMKVKIAESHWVKDILSKWLYGQVKLVEICFTDSFEHQTLKDAYEKIEKAIDHFKHGNDRETLALIYASFESLAKAYKCDQPDQNFFNKFLSNINEEKRSKLKFMFDKFCNYLHLGRHEPSEPSLDIERRDSEFAIMMAQLIYSYLSKLLIAKST